ncbi:UBIQUITIN-CONJUGAT-2 domain-containing protein [Mycena indigotica]|uniref:UBIQUITIN-CONJUGAT-2 domain-containing protein n=1 Tax=Mycena indigotica TaxID=2126181 RepID=A0A8H6SHJ8_9AGAR|nr:UBIQUITIN-CONJUGAT-2 domain-containing protein [Mycena indigotica]KAF7299002.1 UBIQUITIN-CONJUGAT-2 domain-containing protein [Mycena indigotica]
MFGDPQPMALSARLYRDLAELHESTYPGVDVFFDDANIHKFCLVLTPPSGPWKNMSFHFSVELLADWPASPPQVSCSVSGINHPNLFDSYICCDLLKREWEINRHDGYTGGYSPALTLRGLFLQFLTFFSSTTVEQDYGGPPRYIGNYSCVWFARESHLRGGQLPVRGNTHVPGSLFSAATQGPLKEEWEKDKRPIIILQSELTEVGPLSQTTKSPRAGKDRLIRFEEKDPNWTRTLKRISQWTCPCCPYGSSAFPHSVPIASSPANSPKPARSPLMVPPSVCQLDKVDDDALYTIACSLPSETVINFSVAYPRLDAIVRSTHILLQRELRCFFLRTPLIDSVLGIGISLDPRSRALASDFDWLSRRAFSEFGVRLSVEKRAFDFFLPLAFSPQHFQRVYPHIWSSLEHIDKEVRKAEQKMSKNPRHRAGGLPRRQDTISAVYRLMNNIVVSLMRNCDDALDTKKAGKSLLHASEKAVIAYCHLFHLLISLSRTDPVILRDATERLRGFIQRKDLRVKTRFPDLGELIILIMLVICCPPQNSNAPIKWADLAGPFLEEAITRNVRWILKDAPELEVLEEGASDYRLKETFTRSKTSLRLIMFQITFLDLFFRAYASNLRRLDDNYGFPDKKLPETMVEEIKAIYAIDTWPAFFTRVKFAKGIAFGRARFSEMLRDAVVLSGERRYHTPAPHFQMIQLRKRRQLVEEANKSKSIM